MSVLAETILEPRSSLTHIVDSIEQRGLVQRIPTENDARGADATLTREGRRVFACAHRTHLDGIRRRFLNHLTIDQLHGLAQAWEAVETTMEK